MSITVTCSPDLAGSTIPEAIYVLLIQQMFKDDSNVKEVMLNELPGGHSGLSSMAILLAQATGKQGETSNPLLVRVGSKAALAVEVQNYRRYIEDKTGRYLVGQRRYAEDGEYAAVAYAYLRPGSGSEPFVTLREYLWRNESVDAPCRALHTLVCETLAQGTQTSGWYNDPRIHQQQRPLWFYNTVLPPAFTLALDESETPEEGTPELTDLLALADSAAGGDLLKTPVLLRTSAAYPQLHVVERSPERVRLVLYEGSAYGSVPQSPPPIDASTLYQPLPAVAARIDLVGPADILNKLPDVLTRQTIRGHIVDTRYVQLRKLQARLSGLPPGTLLDDPIERFYDLLAQPRSLVLSVIHGDMNLSNILVDVGADEHLTAWLIDFDKTTGNGHTAFDAAKLETEYKVHILAQRLTIGELLRLERALHYALVQPSGHLHYLKDAPQLLEAYQFIATIRRTFLREVAGGRVTPEEYYLGLLAYGLAALKYRNLYSEHNDRWLGQRPAINPLAQAAYLSAAFAATAIKECAGVVVTPECYPPVLLRHRSKRGTRPWLVGRDELIHQVVRRFDLSNGEDRAFARPIVLLHGQPGSGRGAVAAAIGYELEQRGMVVCQWQPAGTATATVEELVDSIGSQLQTTGLHQPVPQQETSSSILGQPTRQAYLTTRLMQLIAILEAQQDKPTITLVLHIDSRLPELRAFVSDLCKRLDQTGIILVTDQPWTTLQGSVEFEVLPLDLNAVRAYVRNERLPLDNDLIRDLFVQTQGMPGVIHATVQRARSYQHQHHCTLKEALMTSITTTVEAFIHSLLAYLPHPLRQILDLDAILSTYTPDAADDLERVALFIGAALGWGDAEQMTPRMTEYRWGPQQHEQLKKLLLAEALASLRPQPVFIQICAALADYYERFKEKPRNGLPYRYLVARYRLLAEQRERAAATLAEFVSSPQLIYAAHCEAIYTLIQEVLAAPARSDEEALLELAGGCAVYLGRYHEAIAHYQELIHTVLLPDDPPYARVLLRLMRAYEEVGDTNAAAETRDAVLREAPPDEPIFALARAAQGAALIDIDPDQAVTVLLDALTHLRISQDQWGDEREFLEIEQILLYDTLAYAEVTRGQSQAAIDYLKRARRLALSRYPFLRARMENNLGYVYYYVRGNKKDVKQAERSFKDAFTLRDQLGDRDGQVKTAQNRANLLVDVATSRVEWDEADALYTRFERFAEKMEAAERDLIVANHVDALILRGDFGRAEGLLSRITIDTIPAPHTRLLLLLNRAKLALHSGDPSACQKHLDAAQPLAAGPGRLTDQVEWSQLALECHLRLGLPLHPQAEHWLAEASLEGDERQADVAELHFARGLLALAQQQYDAALEQFAAAHDLWADVPYPHRVGIVAYWQAHTLFAAGDQTGAQREADRAARLLAPFGATPTAAMLATLQGGER